MKEQKTINRHSTDPMTDEEIQALIDEGWVLKSFGPKLHFFEAREDMVGATHIKYVFERNIITS